MKFKALRKKEEPQEFIEFQVFDNMNVIFTSDLPKPQPMTATLEEMKKLWEMNPTKNEIPWDEYELVTFELFEENTIGADIRNKLTPPLNLIALLRIYFHETDNALDDKLHREKTLPYIKKEMMKSEECIKYIANLL